MSFWLNSPRSFFHEQKKFNMEKKKLQSMKKKLRLSDGKPALSTFLFIFFSLPSVLKLKIKKTICFGVEQILSNIFNDLLKFLDVKYAILIYHGRNEYDWNFVFFFKANICLLMNLHDLLFIYFHIAVCMNVLNETSGKTLNAKAKCARAELTN